MGNFLNNFSKDNYEGLLEEKNKGKVEDVQLNEAKLDETTNDNGIAEEKSINVIRKPIFEEIETNNDVEEKSINVTRKPIFEEIKTSRIQEEHDVVIDTDYKKKKKKKFIIIGAAIAISILVIVLLFNYFNQVPVKNFVGSPVGEVKTWGLKQGVEVEIKYVFDLKYDANIIIEQGVKSGKNIKKGSILKVKVSKGPNMEEKIALPDFSTMDLSKVETWIEKNKANNVDIIKLFDATIPVNSVIKTEIKDTTITPDMYKRKDKLLVYISKGPEVFEKNIVVKDFVNQDKAIVEAWSRENSIEIIYEKAGSDTLPIGSVISQSVAASQKIAKNEKLTVVISIGKISKIPDFSTLTKEDAGAIVGGIVVTVKTQYNEKVTYGKLISQSLPKGTSVSGEDNKVTVIYSEGRPYIDDLTGMKEKELITYFYDFQSKGANITYSVEYVDGQKGIVVSSNHNSEYLPMSINVVVSVGNGSVPTPPAEDTQ